MGFVNDPRTCQHKYGAWGASAYATKPPKWRCNACGRAFAVPPGGKKQPDGHPQGHPAPVDGSA